MELVEGVTLTQHVRRLALNDETETQSWTSLNAPLDIETERGYITSAAQGACDYFGCERRPSNSRKEWQQYTLRGNFTGI
jgi:hypothetical protein